jgi:hypothetical protein
MPKSDFGLFLKKAQELRWRLSEGHQIVYLEYPVQAKPRYGFGKPPHRALHELISSNDGHYRTLMSAFQPFVPNLAQIPLERPEDVTSPYWSNGFFGGLEAIGVYCIPKIFGSKRYMEIGSGNSTKFVRRSISDNDLSMKVTSIDPHPRAEIDALCDNIIRMPLENVDTSIFDQLEENDILVFDGSHRCFQNSDVTVFFLEVLPMLRKGVIVYIDDVYLPYDYPPAWADRFYSEQYILAASLLANPSLMNIMLPCVHIGLDPQLKTAADDLTKRIHPLGIGGYGSGIWMQIAK